MTPSSVAPSARFTAAAGWMAAVGGASVLIGWYFRWPGLHRLHPALGTMSPHAAGCLVLTGMSLSLLASSRPSDWLARGLGLAAAAVVVWIALVTLGVSPFGWTVTIDQRLFHGTVDTLFPGPMPAPTALVFLCLGLALLLLNVEGRRAVPSEFLAFTAALVSLLALVAYGYDALTFFGTPTRRSLAFHTVALLLVLSFGVLLARPARGLVGMATSDRVMGAMVRRVLPAAVGIPILLGWLVTEGQRAGLYPPGLSLAYYTVAVVVAIGHLILRTATVLDQTDLRRQQAEEDIRSLNVLLEQRVIERTAELETVNQELEAFSYSVSHDLRAPLRHVVGFSELLSTHAGPALDEQGRKHLGTITGAAHRMGRLIDDLLAFARIGRSTLKTRPVNLNSLVDEARHEVSAGPAVSGRHIEWHVADLPAVEGDPTMLHLVLVNLFSNAIKYTAPRANARIDVGTGDGDPGEVVVFVRDNGVGFDMKYAGKLFGVFQRLHHASEFEGTGIGLANIKRIVTRHHGRVWAEGRIDRGATFYFSLPRIQADSHSSAGAAQHAIS